MLYFPSQNYKKKNFFRLAGLWQTSIFWNFMKYYEIFDKIDYKYRDDY